MKGIVVTSEGEISVQEFYSPLYQTIGAVVGGYIECVKTIHLPEPYCMIVNEEGKLMNLRLNLIGSWFYGISIPIRFIHGTIVIMKIGMTPEGRDIIGLTDEEAKKLAAELHEMAEIIRRNE